MRWSANTEFDIHPIEWFEARKKKRVVRTSYVEDRVCYHLQMANPIILKEGTPEQIKASKAKALKTIAQDVKKQFDSQLRWGFRFFDRKPEGFTFANFTI